MTSETFDLTVIAERRETGNMWQPYQWRVVGYRASRDGDGPGLVERGASGQTRIQVGSGPLTLHRSEAENYLFNLSGGAAPSVYAILTKPVLDQENPTLHVLTCDPYEAQSFALANDRIVEALAMNAEIETWVRSFVAAHYKEEPFVKRKRKSHRSGPGEIDGG